LPDFHVISAPHGLSLKSQNIKDGKEGGYRYSIQMITKKNFLISASPIKSILSPQVEYAITDEGILKRNAVSVDEEPDSITEIIAWESIAPIVSMKTKEPPEAVY
jgi:hypothetical protein